MHLKSEPVTCNSIISVITPTRHTSDNVIDSQIIQRAVSTADFIEFHRKEKVRIVKK